MVKMSEGIRTVGKNAFIGTAILDNTVADEYGSVYLGKVLLYNKGINKFVKIKESCRVIASAVFINNFVIEEVDFPEGILEIGDRCFENCVSLEKVNISEGLERIGKDTFKNSKLKKVKLPESIVNIGYGAFNNCSELEYINLPHRIEDIAAYSFQNTLYLNNIKKDEFGCKYADDILLEHIDNGVKKIKIKDGTRLIAAETFERSNDIEEVFIPKSVEIILSQAFADCSNLKKVTFEEGIKNRGNLFFYICRL